MTSDQFREGSLILFDGKKQKPVPCPAKFMYDEKGQPVGIGYRLMRGILTDYYEPFHVGSTMKLTTISFYNEEEAQAFCREAITQVNFTTLTYEALLADFQQRNPGATFQDLALAMRNLAQRLASPHPWIIEMREDFARLREPASDDNVTEVRDAQLADVVEALADLTTRDDIVL